MLNHHIRVQCKGEGNTHLEKLIYILLYFFSPLQSHYNVIKWQIYKIKTNTDNRSLYHVQIRCTFILSLFKIICK